MSTSQSAHKHTHIHERSLTACAKAGSLVFTHVSNVYVYWFCTIKPDKHILYPKIKKLVSNTTTQPAYLNGGCISNQKARLNGFCFHPFGDVCLYNDLWQSDFVFLSTASSILFRVGFVFTRLTRSPTTSINSSKGNKISIS